MTEKSQLPRMSWVLLAIINSATMGIYGLIWFANVLRGMNKLNKTPENGKILYYTLLGSYVVSKLCIIIGTIYIIKSFMGIAGEAITHGDFENMSDEQGIEYLLTFITSFIPTIILFVFGRLLELLTAIIIWIFAFQFRTILKTKFEMRIGGLWTFLFTILNIQYAINRAYRSGHLTEDTTTSTLI